MPVTSFPKVKARADSHSRVLNSGSLYMFQKGTDVPFGVTCYLDAKMRNGMRRKNFRPTISS
jgi:hypothetical protein